MMVKLFKIHWLGRAGAILGAVVLGLAIFLNVDLRAGNEMVTICHKPNTAAEKTMTVSASAVDGHFGHGDFRGSCDDGGNGGAGCCPAVVCEEQLVILGVATVPAESSPQDAQRNGADIDSWAGADCAATYGAGARWANTKDLQTLPWKQDVPFAETHGWVTIHPVAIAPNGDTVDISGIQGPLNKLVCASTSGKGYQQVWSSDGDPNDPERRFDSGFYTAGTNAQTPEPISCDNQIPALCVGPPPAP